MFNFTGIISTNLHRRRLHFADEIQALNQLIGLPNSQLLSTSKLSNGLTLARWILFTINLEHLIYDTNL